MKQYRNIDKKVQIIATISRQINTFLIKYYISRFCSLHLWSDPPTPFWCLCNTWTLPNKLGKWTVGLRMIFCHSSIQPYLSWEQCVAHIQTFEYIRICWCEYIHIRKYLWCNRNITDVYLCLCNQINSYLILKGVQNNNKKGPSRRDSQSFTG